MTAGVDEATFSGLFSASGSAALEASATGASSLATSSAAASLAGSSVVASLAASSAGFSSALAAPLPLIVARSLENALLPVFSSPSTGEGDFSRLPKAKGRDDLRFSLTSFLASPLVAGASTVSVGTVAGFETSTARGVVDSTGGMTGAVASVAGASPSLGASVASSAGLADSAGFFSFLEKTLPKKLLRLEGAGFSLGLSAGAASSAGLSSTAAVSAAGAGVSSTLGASASGAVSAATGASSALVSSFFSSFLPKPKKEVRLRLAERRLGSSSLGSSLGAASPSLGDSSALASSALAGSSAGAASLATTGAGLKLSTVFLKASDSVTVAASSLASAILSFSWATQPSRSVAEAALKLCLLPLEVKWNLLVPSTSGSLASAYESMS